MKNIIFEIEKYFQEYVNKLNKQKNIFENIVHFCNPLKTEIEMIQKLEIQHITNVYKTIHHLLLLLNNLEKNVKNDFTNDLENDLSTIDNFEDYFHNIEMNANIYSKSILDGYCVANYLREKPYDVYLYEKFIEEKNEIERNIIFYENTDKDRIDIMNTYKKDFDILVYYYDKISETYTLINYSEYYDKISLIDNYLKEIYIELTKNNTIKLVS
jgi:hypothetical protein